MFFELVKLIKQLLNLSIDLLVKPIAWFITNLDSSSPVVQFLTWLQNVLVPVQWVADIIAGYTNWLNNIVVGLKVIPIWDVVFDLSLLYIASNLLGFFRQKYAWLRPYLWLSLVALYAGAFLVLNGRSTQLSAVRWQSVQQVSACAIAVLLVVALIYRFIRPRFSERKIHNQLKEGTAEDLSVPFEEATVLKKNTNRKRNSKGLSLKELQNHVIMIDENGCPLDLKIDYRFGVIPKLTVLTDQLASSDTAMSSFEERLSQMKAKMAAHEKVVLFVHGGMNDFRPNLRRAAKRCDKMLADGYYPIIVMWRSGLVNCYFAHLFSVRQGKQNLRRIFLLWMVPATLVADIGRGLTRIMKTWYYQFITDMKPHMPGFNPDMENVSKIEALVGKTGTLPNDVKLNAGMDKRINSPVRRMVRFLDYLSPITLISSYVLWPVIDAFSKSAWDVMLRRTKTLFQASYEFEANTLETCNGQTVDYETLLNNSTGALAKFLDFYHTEFVHSTDDDLTTQSNNSDNFSKKELTIIGHSMGTIVVNKILSTIREKYPNFHVENIVYMAAACSTQDAIQAIVPYLKRHSATHFYNLCLHPIREQSEYHFWDFSPRGSLLEWIDSYFTTPLIATDRTFGKWENLLTGTHLFPTEIGSRVHLRSFDVLPIREWGMKRDAVPQFHGDFTRGEFWKSDYWVE